MDRPCLCSIESFYLIHWSMCCCGLSNMLESPSEEVIGFVKKARPEIAHAARNSYIAWIRARIASRESRIFTHKIG